MVRLLAAMEPSNPAYHLYLGWATYRANRKQVKLAERCILEASRLDRQAPEPFLLMSEICDAEGEGERARKFEARGRQLQAADEPSDSGILGVGEAEIKQEMRRALKDFITEERRGKESENRASGLFGRIFKGK
jgi:hypothetical protein